MATGSHPPSLPLRLLRRAFKPFYPAYYRYLWGRRFPMSDALEQRVRAWEDLSTRGDAPQSADAWDSQYRDGDWDLLHNPAEGPRYRRLVELWTEWIGRGTLIDVGAGDAVLRPFLPDTVRYLGLDLSAEAVSRGQSRLLSGDALFAADAEVWRPDRPVEAIVINECAYYFERPLETVNAYRRHLTSDGVLFVSMFETPRSRAIQRHLIRLPSLRATAVVPTSGGARWWMGVFAGDVPPEVPPENGTQTLDSR